MQSSTVSGIGSPKNIERVFSVMIIIVNTVAGLKRLRSLEED